MRFQIADCGFRIADCRFFNPKSAIRNRKLPGECSDKSAALAENAPLPVEARTLEFIVTGVRWHCMGKLRKRRVVGNLVAANMILVAQGPGLNPRQPAGRENHKDHICGNEVANYPPLTELT